MTLVLLGDGVHDEQSEKVLLIAMKDTLQHCLTGNVKVKLALDKWPAARHNEKEKGDSKQEHAKKVA